MVLVVVVWVPAFLGADLALTGFLGAGFVAFLTGFFTLVGSLVAFLAGDGSFFVTLVTFGVAVFLFTTAFFERAGVFLEAILGTDSFFADCLVPDCLVFGALDLGEDGAFFFAVM